MFDILFRKMCSFRDMICKLASSFWVTHWEMSIVFFQIMLECLRVSSGFRQGSPRWKRQAQHSPTINTTSLSRKWRRRLGCEPYSSWRIYIQRQPARHRTANIASCFNFRHVFFFVGTSVNFPGNLAMFQETCSILLSPWARDLGLSVWPTWVHSEEQWREDSESQHISTI